MQRSTVAAALRAQARERQRIVEESGLDDRYFDSSATTGGSYDRDGVARARGQSRVPSKAKMSQSKRAKARAIGGDDDDDDDDEEEEEEENLHNSKGDALDPDESTRNQEESYANEEDELLRLQKEDRSEVPLEAFNLEQERAQGRFDKNGNYEWTRRDLAKDDRDDEGDEWIGDVVDMTTARQKRARDEEDEKESKSRQFHIQRLVDLLKPEENVLKALSRYGKQDKTKLDLVTDSANTLLDLLPDVYQMTQRMLDAEVRRDREERMARIFWEYDTGDGQVYGPFPATTMQAWHEAGYFTGDNKDDLRFRRATAPQEIQGSQGQSSSATDTNADIDDGNAGKRRKVIFAKSAKEDLDDDFDDSDDEIDQSQAQPALSDAQISSTKPDSIVGASKPLSPWCTLSEISFTQVFD